MIEVQDHNARSVTPAVLRWTAVAVLMDLAIVVGAHLHDSVYRLEALAGSLASVIAAGLYTRAVGKSFADSAWHGGMVASIGAFVASATSASLAEHRPLVMLWATLAAFVIGVVSGGATFAFSEFRRRGQGPWRA